MADNERSNIVWRRSTISVRDNAVEVAVTADSVLVRSSSDPFGTVLILSKAEWAAFLYAVNAGGYSRIGAVSAGRYSGIGPEDEEASPSFVTDTVSGDEIIITIYLSDASAHEEVEAVIESWLNASGIEIEDHGDPVAGSWFNRLKARVIAREVAVTAAHAADARFVLAQDAINTATLGQIVAPIIGSLQSTQEAVVRIGAVLIVKFDGKIVVHQLTSEQQFKLDHQPQLARLPDEILSKLEIE